MLEQKLNNINSAGGVISRPVNTQSPTQPMSKSSERTVAQKNSVSSGKSSGDWKTIIDTLKKSGKIRLYTCLVNTTLNKLNDQTWEIEFPNGLTEFNKKILEDSANKNDLIKAIAMLTGNEINIKLKDGKKVNPATTSTTASGFDDLGIDINIID